MSARFHRRALAIGAAAVVATGFAVGTSVAQSTTQTVSLAVGDSAVVNCDDGVLNANLNAGPFTLNCDAKSGSGSTTTTVAPSTTTTEAPSTTTTVAPPTTSTSEPSTPPTGDVETGTPGNCTDPNWSTSDAEGTDNLDPSPDPEYWWMDNDAWNGSAGPQSLYVCNQQSWYAVSDQTNNGGEVETYPNSEYDVGGRANGVSTKPISAYNSITSTFSENYPSAGSWDAAYDMWTNNWTNETMIWNQWAGSQAYWTTTGSGATPVTIDGVDYMFVDIGGSNATPDNGGELVFSMVNPVQSGSVNILAVYQWEVANGYAKASDVPTQLEYGVEICSTSGSETFPLTGLTFSLS
jgi:hypothetical protein